jgi:hypothetical protein
MSNRSTADIGIALEVLAATDVGRGSAQLQRAVSGDLLRAAESLVRQIALARVNVITGFYIPGANPPAAETDGPIGAAQICKAIELLGGEATIVTDTPCLKIIEAAADAAQLQSEPREVRFPMLESEPTWYARQVDDPVWKGLTHIISIERPGPTADGTYRNMSGDDISDVTAPLDVLFDLPNATKIAIGDGANEIGMGRVPIDLIERHVPNGATIRCTVGADHLIIGGTSNWAAQALAALLIHISHPEGDSPELMELLKPSWSRSILKAIVDAGAVDGAIRLRRYSVDGLSIEEYEDVLKAIKAAIT